MAFTIDSNYIFRKDELDSHFKVFAGPGAGKTYLLIENIKNIIKSSEKLKRGNRKVLCITYTNAGADEIRNRLGVYNEYVHVSTIHSFIYDAIIKDNQVQLRNIIKSKFGYELSNSSKLKSRKEGFRLLSKEDEQKVRDFVANDQYVELGSCSRIKLEECIVDISSINKYPFKAEGVGTADIKGSFDPQIKKAIKYGIFSQAQVLDFDEILYFGYQLLKNYKHIVYNLKYMFPYVLVDEYQDTNPIQNAMIKKFADSRDCILGVIGDVAQSIYSFQGAEYNEFLNLELQERDLKEYCIEGNRRSSKNIILFCNFLRQSDNNLNAQSCEKNVETNLPIKIMLVQDKTKLKEKIQGNVVVLARKWAEVFQYIFDIDQEQQKIINDIQNYYTYRMKRDFFTEIEQNRIDWIRISSYIVHIRLASKRKNMAKIIDLSKSIIDINEFVRPNKNQAKSYKEFYNFIKDVSLLSEDITFKEILEKINESIRKNNIVTIEEFKVASSNDDEYFDEKLYGDVNKLNLLTLEKMVLEVFSNTAKFMTIHRAKGQEFDKVLLNISPIVKTKTKEGDGFKKDDFEKVLSNPLVFSDEKEKKAICEYVRIVYVGASRAKNELILCIEDEKAINSLNLALEKYKMEKQIAEKFWTIDII